MSFNSLSMSLDFNSLSISTVLEFYDVFQQSPLLQAELVYVLLLRFNELDVI